MAGWLCIPYQLMMMMIFLFHSFPVSFGLLLATLLPCYDGCVILPGIRHSGDWHGNETRLDELDWRFLALIRTSSFRNSIFLHSIQSRKFFIFISIEGESVPIFLIVKSIATCNLYVLWIKVNQMKQLQKKNEKKNIITNRWVMHIVCCICHVHVHV